MVIKVLNSKLGIHYVFRSHLQPSSRPREPYTKIHKSGNDRNRTRNVNVIPSLEFKTCMTIKS